MTDNASKHGDKARFRSLDSEATLDIPDRHACLIGRVVINASRLEAAIEEIIWRVLDLKPQIGRVVTSRMDFRNRYDRLSVLLDRLSKPDDYTKYKITLERIKECMDERNFIVHGYWVQETKNGLISAISLKPKAPPDQAVGIVYSEQKLERLASNILHCINALAMIVHERFPYDEEA